MYKEKDWDEFFSKEMNSLTFKGIPNAIKLISNYLKSGDILELGCGDGRNVLYLAQKKQYNLLGVDYSEKAIIKLNTFSNNFENLSAKKANILVYNYEKKLWDLIMTTFVLNFFEKKEAIYIIGNMQHFTKVGGFNLILAFINSPDLPRDWKCTFSENELKDNIYKDWNIIKYEITTYYLKDKTPTNAIFLFAQKIK